MTGAMPAPPEDEILSPNIWREHTPGMWGMERQPDPKAYLFKPPLPYDSHGESRLLPLLPKEHHESDRRQCLPRPQNLLLLQRPPLRRIQEKTALHGPDGWDKYSPPNQAESPRMSTLHTSMHSSNASEIEASPRGSMTR